MDERQRIREQIISTYWEIHHERNCGRCEEDEPRAKDGHGESQADRDPADPGSADRGV